MARNKYAFFAAENMEGTDMCVRCARDAEEEGFGAIAEFFTTLADIEKGHEMRYRNVLEAPKACPVRLHPQSYIKAFVEMPT